MDNSVKKQKILTPLGWVTKLMALAVVFSVVLCGCGKDKGNGEGGSEKASMVNVSISGTERKAKVTLKNDDDKKKLKPGEFTLEVKVTMTAKASKKASLGGFTMGSCFGNASKALKAPLSAVMSEEIEAGKTKDMEIEFTDISSADDESASLEISITKGDKKVASGTVKLDSIK